MFIAWGCQAINIQECERSTSVHIDTNAFAILRQPGPLIFLPTSQGNIANVQSKQAIQMQEKEEERHKTRLEAPYQLEKVKTSKQNPHLCLNMHIHDLWGNWCICEASRTHTVCSAVRQWMEIESCLFTRKQKPLDHILVATGVCVLHGACPAPQAGQSVSQVR